MTWLTRIPVLLTLPLFAIAGALLSTVALIAFRLFVAPEKLREQHDVVAALLSVVGVLYSVVLGFLVGTVWTSFDAAQQNADHEVRFAAIAFGYADGLPEPERTRVRRLVAQYIVEVRDREWAMLAEGRADPRARALLEEATQQLLTLAPKNVSTAQALREESVAAGTLQAFRTLAEDRVQRLTESRQRLPGVIFEALILGALMVLAYALFFGSKHFWIQLTTTALLAASIGLFFGLIVDLNAPYRGPIRVSRDAWTAMIDAADLRTVAR